MRKLILLPLISHLAFAQPLTNTLGIKLVPINAINGFHGSDGDMPARGGTPSLTDQEVKNAVLFMLKSPEHPK